MFRKFVSLFVAGILMICTAAAMAAENTIEFTDMYGRECVLNGPVTRVVGMMPADCEILYALGCEEMLVGRGEYCDYPAAVLDLPALGTGDNFNIEEILALDPQVVFMSDIGDNDEQVQMLERNGVRVVLSDTADIASVYTAIRMFGTVTGKETEAEAIVADMQTIFADISAKSVQSGKTVYFEVMPLEWGLWSAGVNTFMHELAGICGVENAFADIDGWHSISEEQVLERDPDYIVLVTGMGDTAIDEVMNRAAWKELKAVQDGMVYNADSYAMTRPGPRLKDAAVGLYRFLNGIEDEAIENPEE